VYIITNQKQIRTCAVHPSKGACPSLFALAITAVAVAVGCADATIPEGSLGSNGIRGEKGQGPKVSS